MPQWVEFTADYDHRWPSGAVTHYPAGTVDNVKAEVAEEAIGLGAAEKTKKPDGGTFVALSPATEHTKVGERTTKRVVSGGAKPGNPVSGEEAPHPADPDALRSEPIKETVRDAVLVAPDSEVEPGDQVESESQTDAVE
jgi:hypothetical protein